MYDANGVYFNRTLISYVHVFNISARKSHALPFILCYELVHANQLILKGDGQIYFVIIIISNVFVIILQNL
jgi:hypothetical protein